MTVTSINAQNKNLALRILTQAFRSNPNITWMARKQTSRYIRGICEHCLSMSMLMQGAYLSSDQKGVILVYRQNGKTTLGQQFRKIFLHLKLLVSSIRLFGIFSILSQQQLLKKHLPKEDHLYCLVLAVSENNKSLDTIIELRDFLFQLGKETGLPIYAQTSLRRNKILFERYGFENYQTVENKSGNYKLWLLKNEAS